MQHKAKMFLNDSQHEFGTLCYSVETPRDEEMTSSFRSTSVDAELRLTDCNSQVNLEFSFYDEKTFRKRLQKINRMIGALQEMRGGMYDCYADMNRLDKLKSEQTATINGGSSSIDCIKTVNQRDADEAASRHNFSEDSFLNPDEVAE